MKTILGIVGSMKTMAVLMLIFAVASGYATFIENDYGTMTARWFEVLLTVLAINLILNIVRFKMIQKKKILVLLFHVSFLVILVGAAITRYYGFEGTMHIREGHSSNLITSSDTYLKAIFTDKEGKKSQYKTQMLLSKMSHNSFDTNVDLEGGSDVGIELLEYIPNATYSIQEDPNGKPIINMMVTSDRGGEPVQLTEGEYYEGDDVVLSFGAVKSFQKPVVSFFVEDGQLYMKHPMNLKYLHMDDKSTGETTVSEKSEATQRTLFTAGATNFVVRDFNAKAKQVLVSSASKSGPMMNSSKQDALRFNVTYNGETHESVV
jgi:hypothetical protein